MVTRLRKWFATKGSFDLAFALVFGAIVLRTLVVYQGSEELLPGILLLAVSLLLFLTQPAITRRWHGHFPLYLALQSGLVIALLGLPIYPDYFAVLFAVLSVQIVERYPPKSAAVLIALFTPVTMVLLVPSLGVNQAIAMGLFYAGVNALMASFAITVQRARQARTETQDLLQELTASNQKLQQYATQLEGFAVVRERSYLARELHDSVTQTLFSMTLTTKAALMLLDRDISRVGTQVDRLNELSQDAQREMRLLIAELRPGDARSADLATAVQQCLQGHNWPGNLQVAMEVCGAGALTAEEDRNLLRIVQEALNNAAKHAEASGATVRLHLDAPFWVEIEDNGSGFDPQQGFDSSHLGLHSMHERAAAIRWKLTIRSAPGAHTCVRVERPEGIVARETVRPTGKPDVTE